MPQDDAQRPGDRIKSFFGRHAAHYAVSPSHRSGPDLDLLLKKLEPGAEDRCLDIATGGGHTAIALAGRSKFVVALDLTEPMAAECRSTAAMAGVDNVLPVVADVHSLPFRRGSFDIVAVRRAPHHFRDPRHAMKEMARVAVPGGRVGVADMTVPDDPAAARLSNALETARDSSHARALGPEEWMSLADSAGLSPLHSETMVDRVQWETWLAPVATGGNEEEKARQLLREADPEARAMVVADSESSAFYLKRIIVLTAVRP